MVVFTSNTTTAGGFDDAAIEAVSLADGHRKTLLQGGTFGRYVPGSKDSGHLVLRESGHVVCRALRPGRAGGSRLRSPHFGAGFLRYGLGASKGGCFSKWAPDLRKRRVRLRGGRLCSGWRQDGKTRPLLAKTGNYGRPSLSPDGRRLALEILDGSNRDIWVQDLERDTATRLTFGGKEFDPIWTPDGRSIVFQDTEGACLDARRWRRQAATAPADPGYRMSVVLHARWKVWRTIGKGGSL